MKKTRITLTLTLFALFMFTACETEQPVDQLLKDETQRSEIIASFIGHQAYRMEMMTALMENDSCRNIMGEKMMENPKMMGHMMKDPTKMMGSMDQMVNMAANDSIVFNDMIQMMKEKPEMWEKVKKMQTATTKTNYHDAR